MRIGIDARFYGPDSKGLGRYTEQLLRFLEKIDTDNDYVVFVRSSTRDTYVPHNPRFRTVVADFAWYSFAEQFLLPWRLYAERCDLVHFPHFNVPLLYRRPFVVTIHDLILLRHPTARATTLGPLWYRVKFAAYKLVIGSAIRRARAVCAVSAFTRSDILSHYRDVDPAKVFVTYEAVTDAPIMTDEEAAVERASCGIMSPYILYAGNAYPHKNLERLLAAFGCSRSRQSLGLVLVGKDDFFYARLMAGTAALPDGTSVRMLPSVSDWTLAALYRGARAFVFPSLYEGFGLPPLEAMAHGCPVAASDATCLPEIMGDAALYFDATDTDAIAAAIDRIATDEPLRATLIERGYRCVGQYAWHRMAEETLAVYQWGNDAKYKYNA